MSLWSNEEIEALRIEISKKAATDENFRKDILANPKGVIEKLAGKKIPEEFSIDVIENKPGVVKTFVLPNLISDSLTKDEMLAVAGGRSTASSTMQSAVCQVQTVETSGAGSTTMPTAVIVGSDAGPVPVTGISTQVTITVD